MIEHDIITKCASAGMHSGDVRWMLGMTSDKPNRNQLFHCWVACFESHLNGSNVPIELLRHLYRKIAQ